MRDVHTRWREDRALGLVFRTGLLALLTVLVLLAVVLVAQGVQRTASWATVLGTGLAITIALVTLVTSWLKRRADVTRGGNLLTGWLTETTGRSRGEIIERFDRHDPATAVAIACSCFRNQQELGDHRARWVSGS